MATLKEHFILINLNLGLKKQRKKSHIDIMIRVQLCSLLGSKKKTQIGIRIRKTAQYARSLFGYIHGLINKLVSNLNLILGHSL